MREENVHRHRIDPRIALLVLLPLNVEVTLYPHLGYQVASMAVVLLLMAGRFPPATLEPFYSWG